VVSSPGEIRFLVLALLVFREAHPASMNELGAFDHHQDVGAAKLAGNAAYDLATQTYTLSSGRPNAGASPEQFHLAWKKLEGDFILQATVRFAHSAKAPRRALGIMVRNSLAGSSP
jgi:TolB protein